MKLGNVDYLDWYINTCQDIEYDLALSSMPPVTQKDIGAFVDDLNFGEVIHDGNPRLIECISNIFGVDQKGILITCGTTHANFLVCASLLSVGDEVVVENPVYTPILDLIRSFDLKIKKLEREFREGFKINPDKLNEIVSKDTRLIILTNLHNPSGAVTEEKTLRAIAEIAEDAGSYTLSDEVYREFMLDDTPPVMSSVSQRCVSTYSLSKFYGAGTLRLGWITGTPELKERVRKINLNIIITNNVASEYFATVILENRKWFIKRVKKVREINFPIVEEWVNSRKDLDWVAPKYGVMAFLKVLKPISSIQLSDRLLNEHRTMISPGHFFGADNYIRIGFSGDSMKLTIGLENLGRVLDDLD